MKTPFYIFLFSTLFGLSLIALDNYGVAVDWSWLQLGDTNWQFSDEFSSSLSQWLVTIFSWLVKLTTPVAIWGLWHIGQISITSDSQPKLHCISNQKPLKKSKKNRSKKGFNS